MLFMHTNDHTRKQYIQGKKQQFLHETTAKQK